MTTEVTAAPMQASPGPKKKAVAKVSAPVPTANLNDMVMALLARPEVSTELVDRAERLLNLHRQQVYAEAMVACQAEMEPVFRDKPNKQTSSRYASFEALDRAARPIYAKHGFSLSFGTADCPYPERIRVTVDVVHVSGMVKHDFLDMPVVTKGPKGNDLMTSTHATMSSLSYAKRGLETMVFNIVTTDDRVHDDDGNRAGGTLYISAEDVASLKAELDSFGADHAQFLDYIGADSFEGILLTQEKAVHAAIKVAKRARAQKAAEPSNG